MTNSTEQRKTTATDSFRQNTCSTDSTHHTPQQYFLCTAYSKIPDQQRKHRHSRSHSRSNTPGNTQHPHTRILGLCTRPDILQQSCSCNRPAPPAGCRACEHHHYPSSTRGLSTRLGYLHLAAAPCLQMRTSSIGSNLRRIQTSSPSRPCCIRCWLPTRTRGSCCRNNTWQMNQIFWLARSVTSGKQSLLTRRNIPSQHNDILPMHTQPYIVPLSYPKPLLAHFAACSTFLNHPSPNSKPGNSSQQDLGWQTDQLSCSHWHKR